MMHRHGWKSKALSEVFLTVGVLAFSSWGCNKADHVDSVPSESEVTAKASPPDEPPPGPIEAEEQKYPNGNPKGRTEGYRDKEGNLVRHGTSTVWYENGDKKSEQVFAHGVPQGPRNTWHIGGKPWTLGQYVDGIEEGKWITYYLDGTLQTEWGMKRGAWHGTYTEWHPNGKKRMEVEFVNGKRQGPSTAYDDQGVAILQTDYVDNIEQP